MNNLFVKQKDIWLFSKIPQKPQVLKSFLRKILSSSSLSYRTRILGELLKWKKKSTQNPVIPESIKLITDTILRPLQDEMKNFIDNIGVGYMRSVVPNIVRTSYGYLNTSTASEIKQHMYNLFKTRNTVSVLDTSGNPDGPKFDIDFMYTDMKEYVKIPDIKFTEKMIILEDPDKYTIKLQLSSGWFLYLISTYIDGVLKDANIPPIPDNLTGRDREIAINNSINLVKINKKKMLTFIRNSTNVAITLSLVGSIYQYNFRYRNIAAFSNLLFYVNKNIYLLNSEIPKEEDLTNKDNVERIEFQDNVISMNKNSPNILNYIIKFGSNSGVAVNPVEILDVFLSLPVEEAKTFVETLFQQLLAIWDTYSIETNQDLFNKTCGNSENDAINLLIYLNRILPILFINSRFFHPTQAVHLNKFITYVKSVVLKNLTATIGKRNILVGIKPLIENVRYYILWFEQVQKTLMEYDEVSVKEKLLLMIKEN